MSFLEISHIYAGYGKKEIVSDVSVSCQSGEIIGILGPNGSGKTTLLKALCGILPHEGQCLLSGEPLGSLSPREMAKRCSYLPQKSGLTLDLSVMDVVCMGWNPHLTLFGQPGKREREQAKAVLSGLGLDELCEKNFQSLSEGQKQLCLLARAVVADPSLLFLDEPESALDVHNRVAIMNILRTWVREKSRAVVMSLHDPGLALNVCDRLLLLKDGKRLDVCLPKEDSLPKLEELFRSLYGALTITRCEDGNGHKQLVLLPDWFSDMDVFEVI